MIRFRTSVTVLPLAWPALLAMLWLVATPARGQHMESCDQVLSIAEELFYYARFGDAAQILEGCFAADMISAERRFDAFLLIARIYYADQKETEAANAVNDLLNLRPGYLAKPPLPPPFIAFVEYQTELRQRRDMLDFHLTRAPARPLFKIGRREWLFIGGGVLATGTAIVLLSGDGPKAPSSFPRPPGPPVP